MPVRDDRHTAALLERIGRLIGTDANASALLPVQWEAMRYLQQANRFSRNSSALTAFLGSTKGTVSQTVKTLESKGLLRNRVDPKDRRRNQLSLTAKGNKLLASNPMEKNIAAIAALPGPTRDALATGLEKLLTLRLELDGRQPFGQCRECMYFAILHEEGNPHYCMLLNEKLSAMDADHICYEQVARPA